MRYINYGSLRRAFNKIYLEEMNKDTIIHINKAPGIDGITNEMFYSNIEKNIKILLKELKENRYYMKRVKRINIPKDPKIEIIDGKEVITPRTRPLSLPCTRDKVIHTAIVEEILKPITENVFTNESFGCRPNRSIKDAIEYINNINCKRNIESILKIDLKGFFDNIDHKILLEMVKGLIKDKRLVYIIRNILETEYIENRKVIKPTKGIYQGLCISPILANLYLHNTIDTWYKQITNKEIYMVRYVDDAIFMGDKEDIETIYRKLRERCVEYKITLSEEKTKIIDFDNQELEFLGYIIKKDNKRIYKYISDKKIKSFNKKLKEIIIKARDLYNKQEKESRYFRKYIVKINNSLRGLYRTYKDTDNYIVLISIYDTVREEIFNNWSNILIKTNISKYIKMVLKFER